MTTLRAFATTLALVFMLLPRSAPAQEFLCKSRCPEYSKQTECTRTAGCEWQAPAKRCAGSSAQNSSCAAHSDKASCVADAGCAWKSAGAGRDKGRR